MKNQYHNIVIGGGFFGCMIAQHIPGETLLLDSSGELLSRASTNNQARVHNGYHYPRSTQTALSSHKNYPRFLQDFSSAILDYDQMLYPIAYGSKTPADVFLNTYKTLGCPIEDATIEQANLFNHELIERVFQVEEKVFDGNTLRALVKKKLQNRSVLLNTTVLEIAKSGDHLLVKSCTSSDENQKSKLITEYKARRVIVCSYSHTNIILKNSHLPEIPLIIEHTAMPLIQVPNKFKDVGITIMDGEFFSVIPFPMQGCHSIHHVKLTPISADFKEFKNDIARFIPSMKDIQLCGWIREEKVIFPANDLDDGRPILCKRDYSGIKGLDVIVGGKLDNIYDIFDHLDGKDMSTLNII